MKDLDEIGIILSYIFMLVACYVFEWQPFMVLFSYLWEIVVLLFMYFIVRMGGKRVKKQPLLINIFIGIIPFLLFQTGMIAWISKMVSTNENAVKDEFSLTVEIVYIVGSILLFYIIKVIRMSSHKERMEALQYNLVYRILALGGINMAVLLLIMIFEIHTFLVVLVVMVAVRIVLELYFRKKMTII